MDNAGPSDADKIRLKRLAKLQQQAEEQKAAAAAAAAAEANNAATSSTPVNNQSTASSKPIQSSTPTPPAKPVATPANPATPKSPAPATSTPPSKPVPSPTPKAPAKSFEDWQNEVLSRILQVTLNLDTVYKQGRCVYLHGLVSELEEENEPKPYRLSEPLLDRILVARLSIDPNESNDEYPEDVRNDLRVLDFDYLLACWKRAHEIKRNTMTRSKNLDPAVLQQRLALLDNTKALLISYSGLTIQMPDMFPQIQSPTPLGPEQLVPRLLAEPDTAEGLPSEYLVELVARFSDDGLDQIIGSALVIISSRLQNMNILDDYKSSLRALTNLCENKTIAGMITSLPEFDPSHAAAHNIENISLLGPFLSLTAYPDRSSKVAENFFQNAEERYSADIESCMNGIRATIHNIQRTMFGVINNIVRSSPQAREAVLSYFAHILQLNVKRAQMQVDPLTVASEGFMHNIAAILLSFCEPFMDVKASKIDKIEPTYFRTSRRLDVTEDTKVTADKEQSDRYYNSGEPKAHNFISDIFYLTLGFYHYGPIRSFVNYNEFKREHSEMKRQMDRMEQDIARMGNTPMQDFLMQRLKARLDLMSMHKFAYESMLMDEEYLSETMRFYNLVMSWMIRTVDPKHQHPWAMITLPLPKDVPEDFAMLPEWIIEDVVEFFIFLGKYCYHMKVFKSNSQEELVTFIITFLRNTQYIKNPYLKAKLVEILFFFTYPIAKGVPGELETMLNSHPLALDHLMVSLMTFYVEVEQTGTSSQFYDKFNIRYNISHIMKTIWGHPAHRAKLREESKNHEMFTRFVNMLMSDVTYLLDESLSKLSEIHQIQLEMEDTAAWEAQPVQQRQEREGNLRSLERQAQSYVALGSETVHMLQYLTAEVVEPFMVTEVVDRLAAMLDYNLAQLVGPKCTELKVKNREKYHFQPRVLLSEIIDIYLHLNCPTFVEAVARDGRSYKKEYFSKAASIMLKQRLKHPDDVAALESFVNKVEEAIQCGVLEEEELGDVPDEFLDPILSSVMEDPVLLPTSNTIVDRSTIRAHLLGDTRDPFSRAPLSMDMVEPADELKAKIQAWRLEQKSKRNATKAGDDPMDTSA
ncbi:ubiquitin conjugation factor e4 [Lichtheimia corymbifera JMRC:FSU:9682]|uniref:RING-type E3 ubiquitin transferase n=1 Tax=Lichtheimia corymbifera JMRC:FSU:9682 TaxID=1263082 RepID=A0A068RLZ2_9FUNG|nr:ubiquitin conjugation factor e4 [Lichtheimia corymbifera JMRC:FSU:9682]